MNARRWAILACGLLLLLMTPGCGGAQQQPAQDTAQAKLQLTADAMYPFLTFTNQGTVSAEGVEVVESKTGDKLQPIAWLQKADGQLQAKTPPDSLKLAPGEGAQYQVRAKELLDYTVRWTEAGKPHEQALRLPNPQKIETH